MPNSKVGLTAGLLAIGAIAGFLLGVAIEHTSYIEIFSGRTATLLDPGESYPYQLNRLYGIFRIVLGALGAIAGGLLGQLIVRWQHHERTRKEVSKPHGA
ncbi:MAG: hypothetical protein HY924_00205 [Elusimicrobia bacterium]|nr:hypothetical protein [Elusimicrobiota bacterium]